MIYMHDLSSSNVDFTMRSVQRRVQRVDGLVERPIGEVGPVQLSPGTVGGHLDVSAGRYRGRGRR